MIAQNKNIIFFDGKCILCLASVRFILKKDKKKRFYFALLQSDDSKEFLLQNFSDFHKKDSLLLLDSGKMFSESNAVLKIAIHFGGFWKFLFIFWIVPRFIRDGLYRLVAKHRYKWFGVQSECMIPDISLKERFL